jgi:hypothetical protein
MAMALSVTDTDKELLLEEIQVFADSLREAGVRARYTGLWQAVAAGEVPDDLVDPLERFLEIGLQTGRFRRIHGPPAEQALLRLFRKTRAGAAIAQATNEVNQALETLRGHVIEEMVFTPQGPGVYRLVIDTDQCQVTLEIDREGVWMKNVGIGV